MAKEITEQGIRRENMGIFVTFAVMLIAVFVFPTYIMPVLGTTVSLLVFTVFAFVMAYNFFKPWFEE